MDFQSWLDETLQLQRAAFGQDPPALKGDEQADWLMMNLLAIHCETTELADEIRWKPWTQPRGGYNRELVISECCDLMHFLGNILATISCTGAELEEAYLKKVDRNYQRQALGDDGVSRRCPHCKRSIDDTGLTIDDDAAYCNGCGGKV